VSRPVTDSSGFTLVELLVASLIALSITAAVMAMAGQAQRIFQAQPEESDVQQRIRVGVDVLHHDIVLAGAGTYAGPALGSLADTLASVMPYRAFGNVTDPASGTFYRTNVISLLYVPATPAQTMLAAPLLPGALDVQLAAAPNCPAASATRICALEAGSRVVVFDESSHWDVYNVDQIGVGIVTLGHRGPPSPTRYEIGAAIAESRLSTYSLKSDPSTGLSQLTRFDGWASEQPVIDDVVALRFDYFGDPQPPRLTGRPLGGPGPWTTYGPPPPSIGQVRGVWPAGENCIFTVVNGAHAERLATLGGGGVTPVQLTSAVMTDGPWCPDGGSPNRFDADLLRVRRVRVTLRVQSAAASLRGPAGALFFRRGSARASDLLVPDLEVQFDVTPRNLNLAR
jgi:hypothetical protein